MKRSVFASLFLFAGLIAACRLVSAQVLPAVQQKFERYEQRYGQEKLYVHTSKSTFITGEIVWFKIYYTDAENHPFSLSKLAYVDVLDDKNSPLLQAKISLNNGSGNGSLYLPVTAGSGNYTLRAYTSWMKNFGPEAFFEKQLTIINPQKSPPPAAVENTAVTLGFFPEGGDMIDGLPGTVAFHATGSDGKGRDVNGVIVNQRNDTLARIQTTQFGMGKFSFTPSANDTYKAIVRSGRNGVVIKELPLVRKQGYALHLDDAGEASLQVTVSTNLPAEFVYLVVQNGKMISQALRSEITGKQAKFTIDKGKLPPGISCVTAFNADQQPVAERLYFNQPQQQLVITASGNAASYTGRKKVAVNILTRDEKNAVKQASLSMTVYRLDSLPQPGQQTIESYFWLTSGLTGTVESPDYYLSGTGNGVRQATDNLLLTQGWRRFKWNDVLAAKEPSFSYLPEVDGHLVTGTVTNDKGARVANRLTYLGVTGKRTQFYAALSDSTGHFSFNTKDFYGTNEIAVQTNYEMDSTDRVNVLSPFDERTLPAALPPFIIDPGAKNAFAQYNLSTQVQLVYSGNELHRFINPGIDSSAFYGHQFRNYRLDDYVRFTTMEEVLREYVPEVSVLRRQKRIQLRMSTATGLPISDGKPMLLINGTSGTVIQAIENPLVLLDGIPYFNMDRVIAIDPLKVKDMEIVAARYFYGPSKSEGIINFKTYKNDLGGTEIDPHALVLDYEGMQLEREFYTPDYTSPDAANSRIPDFRNVLTWIPDIHTDKQGNTKLSFFTSDLPGKYRVEIQGLTPAGIPGSTSFVIDVLR